MGRFSIAIDGPAGAGKSTIAKCLAKQLGFIYVDTGAMYRAMGVYLLRTHVDATECTRVEMACVNADITISYNDQMEQQVFLNGENVTPLLRTEEVGKMASACSKNAAVREKLVSLQQKMAKEQSVVMDGRDIGTKVLPNADLKIYLTAGSLCRAQRRYLELTARGEKANLNQIEADIIERDRQDMNREISPLRQAEDAIYLDCSTLSIEEVVAQVMQYVKERTEVKDGE